MSRTKMQQQCSHLRLRYRGHLFNELYLTLCLLPIMLDRSANRSRSHRYRKQLLTHCIVELSCETLSFLDHSIKPNLFLPYSLFLTVRLSISFILLIPRATDCNG